MTETINSSPASRFTNSAIACQTRRNRKIFDNRLGLTHKTNRMLCDQCPDIESVSDLLPFFPISIHSLHKLMISDPYKEDRKVNSLSLSDLQ